MSDELHHECGVAALCLLAEPAAPDGPASLAITDDNVSVWMPAMLLDLQNRGQLAAGLSSFQADRNQLLDTFKDVGTVSEVFRMGHPARHREILREYAGAAAIGHTRYATCGQDDARYAQPFERHHGRLWKWFSFAFNGNLANYAHLRDRILSRRDYHFTLDTDTEILMHSLSYQLRGDRKPSLRRVMSAMSEDFDGAYNLVYLDAAGRLFVARDPLGFRPLSWAVQGRLFAAASESVALSNIGFTNIQSVRPGEMAVVENGKLRFERFAPKRTPSHCFFEWVYFSNVASVADERSVYLSRARAGQRLADTERERIDGDCIVVPVPDTAKAAADAFAYRLGIPSVEGLIRNRYVGRTFIQPKDVRGRSAHSKYTPLPAVLSGKRVFLVDDSIVRSTTMKELVKQLYERGEAREVHVRVACPPIIAPCFYGIDMSTFGELFAPPFAPRGYRGNPTPAMLKKMARSLRVNTLRYLDADELGPCIQIGNDELCRGCVTGQQPTPMGRKLIRQAKKNKGGARTYEQAGPAAGKRTKRPGC